MVFQLYIPATHYGLFSNGEGSISHEMNVFSKLNATDPSKDCNSPSMKCFDHDNDHWKTPPLWNSESIRLFKMFYVGLKNFEVDNTWAAFVVHPGEQPTCDTLL